MRASHLVSAVRSWLLFKIKGKAPFSVTMDLTHRCTANCLFCQIQADVSEEMTTQQVKAAIDQFRSIGASRMAFTGGDVLLRDDLGGLVRHAKGKGLFVSINSNGNLALDHAELLAEADMVVFSLDGDPEDHLKTKRGTDPGKIMRAIEQAEARRQTVSTITVLTSQNLGSVPWILRAAADMRFSVTFQPVLRCDMSPDLADSLVPDPKELRCAVEAIIRAANEGAPVMNSIRYLRMVADGAPKRRAGDPPCVAGRFYCSVLPNGVVVPCHAAYKRAAFLNGVEVGFDRAFLDMPAFECEGCLSTAYTELDLVASGHPGLAWRALKQLGVSRSAK